jgi:hypothetical protein
MVARIWFNVPRYFELKLKGRGKRTICPICKAEAALSDKPQSTVKTEARQEA